ncbi:hypothetical protein ACFLSJ_06545 [Verrucomicrobiota bacterium]
MQPEEPTQSRQEDNRPPKKAMLVWYVTLAIIWGIVILAGFFCFSPRFNYRLRRSLEPMLRRREARLIERRLEEDRARLSAVVLQSQRERERRAEERSDEAASNSLRYLKQRMEGYDEHMEHLRNVARPGAGR